MQHGADVVVTEFLSAEGIRRENPATVRQAAIFSAEERPIGVQIFGAEPAAMAEAAALGHRPVPSPISSISTSAARSRRSCVGMAAPAVLRDLDLVQQIIRAVSSGDAAPGDVQDSQWLERGDA